MTDKDIIQIATMNGWKASVREETDGTKYVSFRRYMKSEMPFVFTVEVYDGRADSLAAEIISLVDAIDPEACAREWMVKSGAVPPSMFSLAVADMDGIRTETWLLACAFLEFSGKASCHSSRKKSIRCVNVRSSCTCALSLEIPFS